jgi:hypothetical protein
MFHSESHCAQMRTDLNRVNTPLFPNGNALRLKRNGQLHWPCRTPLAERDLKTPSTAKVLSRLWHVTEWVWSIGEMALTGENRSTPRETCPVVTLSTINPTRTGLESNPGLRSEGRRITAIAMASPEFRIESNVDYTSLWQLPLLSDATCDGLQVPGSVADWDSALLSAWH